MSLKISNEEVFYEELKIKLAKKNTLVLDLYHTLLFKSDDPKLLDFLLSNLSEENQTVKFNTLICVCILLLDFNLEKKLDEKSIKLINKYIEKFGVETTIEKLMQSL